MGRARCATKFLMTDVTGRGQVDSLFKKGSVFSGGTTPTPAPKPAPKAKSQTKVCHGCVAVCCCAVLVCGSRAGLCPLLLLGTSCDSFAIHQSYCSQAFKVEEAQERCSVAIYRYFHVRSL